MARGLQKIQAQQKAQAKGGKAGNSTLKTRESALKIKCPKCFTPMSDYKNFAEHFEAKHPKETLPTEEQAKAFAIN
ncbi:hypothetical protein OIO90_004036 [Microbotryomycetes sp. JL221]|nr:hypothetical protein OIO90_004036 [Microbotryomycetes sp. JL221]